MIPTMPETHRILLFLLAALFASVTAASDAYPTIPGTGDVDCTTPGSPVPLRREVYGNGNIFDVTHRITSALPSVEPMGEYLWLAMSMKNGSLYNLSFLKFDAHTGTHVDAPGHYIDRYFDAGFDVDSLDLEVLNGPALLIDVPRNYNITSEVMESLKIPRGVKRVLFRTLNTDRGLMYKDHFDTSYTGFTEDGAKWLVENTGIKLVGIDYLPVAAFDDLVSAHLALLENRDIVIVEGMKLDDVPAGLYNVHCLPLRLPGAEGAPARCILMK